MTHSDMISVSTYDFMQAIRLMKVVSRFPGKNLREDEAKRLLGLMAKRWEKKLAANNKEASDPAVERIYAAYPSKCPVSKRGTGKSSKDKHKIARLLRDGEYTEESLTEIIKRYLKESAESQSYIKNFATFLNNIPDYSEEPEQPAPQPTRDDTTATLFSDPAWQDYLAERSRMYANQNI